MRLRWRALPAGSAMIRPFSFAHDYETVKEIGSSRLSFLMFVYEKLMDVNGQILVAV